MPVHMFSTKVEHGKTVMEIQALLLKSGATDILRFKSRPAVDELIVALMTHPKRVWPD